MNDQAFGDYLLFDTNFDHTTTFYADIRRLAPGHSLTLSDGAARVRRYWSLPIPEFIRYRRTGEHLEQFKELMD